MWLLHKPCPCINPVLSLFYTASVNQPWIYWSTTSQITRFSQMKDVNHFHSHALGWMASAWSLTSSGKQKPMMPPAYETQENQGITSWEKLSSPWLPTEFELQKVLSATKPYVIWAVAEDMDWGGRNAELDCLFLANHTSAYWMTTHAHH